MAFFNGRFLSREPQVSLIKISDAIDLSGKLVMPKVFPWLTKVYTDPAEALPDIALTAPVDGSEIVEWMHSAAAIKAVLYGMMEEYNSVRGRRSPQNVAVVVDDGYIPGCALSSDFSFQSKRADNVVADNNAILITPAGTVNMTPNSARTFISSNFLGWAAATNFGMIQWVASLIEWVDPIAKPFSQRIRCARVNGFVAPQFFKCPTTGLFRNTATLNFTSDIPQTVTLVGRSLGNYQTEMFRIEEAVTAGESEITYTVFGRRMATSHLLQVIPQNNTNFVINSLLG